MEDLSWIMDRLPDEGVGMCLDTSHTALGGCLFEAIERFGRRLLHVQASDNPGHIDDHLVRRRGSHRLAAGHRLTAAGGL